MKKINGGSIWLAKQNRISDCAHTESSYPCHDRNPEFAASI